MYLLEDGPGLLVYGPRAMGVLCAVGHPLYAYTTLSVLTSRATGLDGPGCP